MKQVRDVLQYIKFQPCDFDEYNLGIRSLNWDGRAVVIGFAGGTIPKIPANILLVKNVTLTGLYWGAHALYNKKLFLESSQEVIRLWVNGVITPHIAFRCSLDEVNKAFELLESRNTTGKIIIIP